MILNASAYFTPILLPRREFKDFNILLKGGQYTLVFKDYDIERKIGFSLVDSNGERVHKRVGSFSNKKFTSLIN